MPRSANVSVANNFLRGLVTEATGLNFPENAVTDTSNCVFDERGIVRRRLGLDFESGYAEQTVARAGVSCASYYWKAAAGSGDNSLAVIQIGDTLYFYLAEEAALSTNMVDTLDLSAFEPAGAPSAATAECQFASGNGYLFVSHPTLEPFFVEYDPDTETVSGTQIDIEVRDFEGVEDGLELDERPTTLSSEHDYNLKNQGWFVEDFPLNKDQPPARDAPTFAFFLQRGDYPANNDTWPLFVGPDPDGVPAEYFHALFFGYDRGNSPAPKGHFILGAFYQDRSAVSNSAGLDVVSSGFYRPSTIEFFAGRIWYSGVRGQEFSNRVYFSQIVERVSQFGECYQANDPTDRELFDLLPTDGGVISIPDSGTIVKLFAIENSILVFATNGVWGITGSEGIGFTANDFTVRKLSSIPALTASSFVSVSGLPAWWTEEGIFIASVDPNTGSISISSLTDETIKSFYDAIPATNKRFAKGAFNSRTRVIHWVYRSDAFSGTTEAYEYDSVLNFNVLTRSFYPWTIDNSPVSINGVLVVEGQAANTSLENVTNSSLETVTDSTLENVQVFVTETVNLSSVTKFIASYFDDPNHQLTFADEANTSYLDWEAYDDTGVDFTSDFTSGYALHGDAQRKFQPTYTYIFNKTNNQQSQFDFRSQHDYANSGDTGRWSSTQRLVFPALNYDYQYKRVKTRGSGIVLQFNIKSVTGLPFFVIGWSAFETQNQLP